MAEGRGSATLSEKLTLRECFGSLFKTKVCRAQVHDFGKEGKLESIDLHGKCIAEEIMEEAMKGVENENFAGSRQSLITVLIMLVQKG